MWFVITIIANPGGVRLRLKSYFFPLLFAGLSLVVASLFDQQFYSGLSFYLRDSLLLHQASNHRRGEHHFVFRVHGGHGPDFLPLHR